MQSVPRRLRLNASGERAGRESEALAGVRELLEQARRQCRQPLRILTFPHEAQRFAPRPTSTPQSTHGLRAQYLPCSFRISRRHVLPLLVKGVKTWGRCLRLSSYSCSASRAFFQHSAHLPRAALSGGKCRRGFFNAVHLRQGTSGKEQGKTRYRVVNGHGVKMRFPDGTSGPSPAKTRCGRRSILPCSAGA